MDTCVPCLSAARTGFRATGVRESWLCSSMRRSQRDFGGLICCVSSRSREFRCLPERIPHRSTVRSSCCLSPEIVLLPRSWKTISSVRLARLCLRSMAASSSTATVLLTALEANPLCPFLRERATSMKFHGPARQKRWSSRRAVDQPSTPLTDRRPIDFEAHKFLRGWVRHEICRTPAILGVWRINSSSL
jgi:hypothetical protein